MKKKLYIMVLIMLGSFILTFSPRLSAAIDEAYAINTNPGENANVEMRVSWHMPLDKTNGKIVYTTKTDTNWDNAITLYPDSYESTAFYGMKFLHYQAVLTDLEPATEYMYQVGETNLSETYYFKTAGSPSFSFVWAGDWHTYTPIPSRLESAMAIVEKAKTVEPNLDFFFSTGDIVAYGSDYDAWLDLFANNPYKEYMWVNMIGNHDALNNVTGPNTDNYFAATHNYPKNGYEGQEGKSYYFKYNNVLFFALNSEDMGKVTPVSEVQEWMASVIKNNPTQYIFVSMHYQWFNGVTGANSQYNNWKTFFDEYQVDLALAGNNHVYVRTKKLYEGVVNSEKGTVYIQVPSSDNDRGQTMNETYSNTDIIAKRWTEGLNTVGAIIVTVDAEKIKTRLIDREGKIMDQATIFSQKQPLSIDKTSFKESFSAYPSIKDENSVVITSSVDGIGRIEKIEYYNENTLLGINYYVRRNDLSYTINHATGYDKITAKIYFNDKTTEEVDIKVINQDFYKINNLATIINNSDLYLKWDYQGEAILKAWVFVNGIKFKEVTLSDELVLIENGSITDNIEIRIDENSLSGYYHSKYNTFGDVNLNGTIDEEDIILLQQFLLGTNTIGPNALTYLDVDSDNQITLYDVTYIHLFINDYLDSLSNTDTFTITYLDMFGEEISKETVNRGNDGTYPMFDVPSGYILSGWSKDVRSVNQDLIVQAIIEIEGSNHE